MVPLIAQSYLDSHSSYSFVTDIVPSSHLRQKCEKKLSHINRDMKDRLMNMKTRTDSQKRKLLDTFTNRHLEHLFDKYYGAKQRKDCAVHDEASSSQMSTFPLKCLRLPLKYNWNCCSGNTKKFGRPTPKAHHEKKILYERTKEENLETELNDLKAKIANMRKEHILIEKENARIEQDNPSTETMNDEVMDTTSAPTSDLQHCPSAAMINRLCGFLMKHLR
ncbi:hypothetical protein BC941DRAFT_476824 [Chlamydoabsidia padenii]|nr:hypothetical protein BC941DRAFT_476824 [Chlamydoabsidia padenii]